MWALLSDSSVALILTYSLLTMRVSFSLSSIARRDFHIIGFINLDVAHDRAFEAVQPAICPGKRNNHYGTLF